MGINGRSLAGGLALPATLANAFVLRGEERQRGRKRSRAGTLGKPLIEAQYAERRGRRQVPIGGFPGAHLSALAGGGTFGEILPTSEEKFFPAWEEFEVGLAAFARGPLMSIEQRAPGLEVSRRQCGPEEPLGFSSFGAMLAQLIVDFALGAGRDS
jgi:hypothetical protein